MENNRGFAFYENFWTSVQALPLDQQKDVFYAIIKYGITGEEVSIEESPIGFSFTQAFKPSLDNSVDRFNHNQENGKRGGRPSKIDSEKLRALVAKGMTAQAISEELGVSKSTIEKRDEWKHRNDFHF